MEDPGDYDFSAEFLRQQQASPEGKRDGLMDKMFSTSAHLEGLQSDHGLSNEVMALYL